MWRDGGGYTAQLACVGSLLPPCESKSITQAVRIGGQCFYPPSHLAGPTKEYLSTISMALVQG